MFTVSRFVVFILFVVAVVSSRNRRNILFWKMNYLLLYFCEKLNLLLFFRNLYLLSVRCIVFTGCHIFALIILVP